MTIMETPGGSQHGDEKPVNKPIEFSALREERRAERLRQRGEKSRAPEISDNETSSDVFARKSSPDPYLAPEHKVAGRSRREKKSIFSWTFVSFLLIVVIPTLVTGYYYALIASPQYQVETQFSVRGSNQPSTSPLGIVGGLLGSASVQSGDSYILTSYIESAQIIRDIRQGAGIDLRRYFTSSNIDVAYRIEPDMPPEAFVKYWQKMTDVSFNATTGSITLYVYAFSADDAKEIADAVLKVSEKLVNTLSEKSRQQATIVASKQVDRAEDKLRKVREQIRALRIEEKAFDPNQIAALENTLTSTLESQLSSLKTRLLVLLETGVSRQSPQARVIKRQIDALEQQISARKSKMGADTLSAEVSPNDHSNLAGVLTKFEVLNVEQGFATQAYTTALASFETALAEAQRQERYFATFIAPTKPEIALYPTRILDCAIGFVVFLGIWMMSQFFYRSFRDHSI